MLKGNLSSINCEAMRERLEVMFTSVFLEEKSGKELPEVLKKCHEQNRAYLLDNLLTNEEKECLSKAGIGEI